MSENVVQEVSDHIIIDVYATSDADVATDELVVPVSERHADVATDSEATDVSALLANAREATD